MGITSHTHITSYKPFPLLQKLYNLCNIRNLTTKCKLFEVI